MHACVKCENWFHKHCLHVCGIKPPKRTQDFICPNCTIPPTVPWSHPKYVNTCTSDNVLTIIILHCLQHHKFLENIGTSAAENTLKAAIKLMLQGNMCKGKEVILDHVTSVLTFNRSGQYLDCYGSEYAQFIQLFRHIWTLSLILNCESRYCPNPSTQRHQTSFCFQPPHNNTFSEQLAQMFPAQGDKSGYCGQQFHDDPPENSEYGLNERENLTTKQKEVFFECRGSLIIQSSNFLNKCPWMIPIQINSFKADQIRELTHALPTQISVHGRLYKLAGYSMLRSHHYTAVIFWKGRKYFYDGLGQTDEVRFRPAVDADYFGQEGSYALYLLI